MSYTYADLKEEVAAYPHRTDLSLRIPRFIDKARSRIGRDVRALANLLTVSLTGFVASRIALPADYAQKRRLSDLGNTLELTEVPPQQVAAYMPGSFLGLGSPTVYAITDLTLWVPGASDTQTYELEYWAVPHELVNDADVSFGMTEWPQIWLNAALLESAFFSQDWDMHSKLLDLYAVEVGRLNASTQAALYTRPAVQADITLSHAPAFL